MTDKAKPSPSGGVYLARILRAVSRGSIDSGCAAFVQIAHDDTCGAYKGAACDCDPEITIKSADGAITEILADGSLRPK